MTRHENAVGQHPSCLLSTKSDQILGWQMCLQYTNRQTFQAQPSGQRDENTQENQLQHSQG